MTADRVNLTTIWALALFGGGLTWMATVNGPALSPDSVSYLRSVRGLLNGITLVHLGTHHPPGYPMLWAAISTLTGNEFTAARLIGSASLALAILGFGLSLRTIMPEPRVLIIGPALLALLLSPGFSPLFWWAVTEGPFLACLSIAIYAALIFSRNGHHRRLLYFSLAVMLLMRYAAAPLVVTLIVWATVSRYGWNRLACIRMVTALALVTAPLALWLGLSSVQDGTNAVREFALHPPTAAHAKQALLTLSRWFGQSNSWLALFFYSGVVLAALLQRPARQQSATQLALLMTGAYLLFLSLSLTFFDGQTPLDWRILVPLLPLWLIMLITLPALRVRPALLGSLLLILAMANAASLRPELRHSIMAGEDFTNLQRRRAPIFRTTATLPAKLPIYTNAGEYYYIYYHRETRSLPQYYNPITGVPNENLDEEWDAVIAAMHNQQALIVWSPFTAYRHYLPTVDDMLGFGMLEIEMELEGGTVLKLREGTPANPAIE